MAEINFTEMFLVPKDIYDKVMSLNCQSDKAHLMNVNNGQSSSNQLFVESVPRPPPTFQDFNPRHDTNLPHVFPEPMGQQNGDPSTNGGNGGFGPQNPTINPTTTTTTSSQHLSNVSSIHPPPSDDSYKTFDINFDELSNKSSNISVPSATFTPPVNENLNRTNNSNNSVQTKNSENSVPSFDDRNLTPPVPPFIYDNDVTMESDISSLHNKKGSVHSKKSFVSDISSINKKYKQTSTPIGSLKGGKKKPENYPNVDEKYRKEKISREKKTEKPAETKETFKKPSTPYPSMDQKYAKEKINVSFKESKKKEKKSNESFTSSKKGISKKQQQQAKITEDIMKMSPTTDPYTIMGVNFLITKAGLKKAFQSLSKLIHPDKNKHEFAHEAFVKVTEAYHTILKELETNEAFMKDFQNRSGNEKNSSRKQEQQQQQQHQRHQRSDFNYRQNYRPSSEYEEKQKRETERIMRANVNDHFEVLNIPKTASLVELKSQYYLLSNLIDPRNNLHPEAMFAFVMLNDSYKILYNQMADKIKENYGKYGAKPKTPRGPPTNQRNTAGRASNLRPPPNPYGFKWYND